MLVGVGNEVRVETELPVVILLLLQLVGVMLILVRLVKDAVVLKPELLEGNGDVLEGVPTSVVPALELVDVPIVIEEDDVLIQESLSLLFVIFGAVT